MADDVTFQSATPATPPAATVVAADVIGGVAWQRMKLGIGADGTAVDFSGAVKTAYGTEAQALTCTLASLASSATAGRESTAVDNTTNLFLDALVQVRIKLTTGTPGNDKRVYIWVYGTVDAATPVYPDKVTGSDAAITMDSPTNLRLLGIIEAPAQSTSYTSEPLSVAEAFGGRLPEKWGVVVQNYTNIAFTATAGDHKVLYQGVSGKLV